MGGILFVCADSFPSSFAHQCKSAFQQLGHEVTAFNYRAFHLHRFAIGRKLISAQLLRVARNVKPDALITIKGEALLPGTITNIRKLGIPTANWILDEPFGKFSPFNRVQNMAEYDRLFLFDDDYAEQLTAKGMDARYLPVGVDPTLYTEQIPVADRQYLSDVGFIGSHHPQREALFTKLAEAGVDLRVSGYRWNTVPKTSPLSPHLDPQVLKANARLADLREMCRQFNLTRINLNLHHAQAIGAGASLRLFECTATNSFLMSDHKPGLEKLFKPDREMVFYRTTAELLDRITYYRSNDSARLKIAAAAQKRLLRDHQIIHRMKAILHMLR